MSFKPQLNWGVGEKPRMQASCGPEDVQSGMGGEELSRACSVLPPRCPVRSLGGVADACVARGGRHSEREAARRVRSLLLGDGLTDLDGPVFRGHREALNGSATKQVSCSGVHFGTVFRSGGESGLERAGHNPWGSCGNFCLLVRLPVQS